MINVGQLTITLRCLNGKVVQARIQSTRPLQISRLLIGKTPEQVLKTVPLLFNVCNVAQAFAAFTALSHALGYAENPAANSARQLLLNVEIVREHAWWLLLNLDKAKLAPFLQFVKNFKAALFVDGDAFSLTSQLQVDESRFHLLINQLELALDDIFAGQRFNFLAIKNAAELEQWLKNNATLPAQLLQDLTLQQQQSLARTELNLLPKLPELALHQILSQANTQMFIAYPTWQGQCYETGCLNRQQFQPLIADLLRHYGNGLVTRLASRLIELANMPDLIRQELELIAAGSWPEPQSCTVQTGIAQIQASRGLLIHRVEVTDDKIATYQIVAPTEWNFHPQGVAALSLQQLCADDHETLRQQAAQVIHAIDPCVGFELFIEE